MDHLSGSAGAPYIDAMFVAISYLKQSSVQSTCKYRKGRKKMLMCLDYIKVLRLTKRKGEKKSANGQSSVERHYYITSNAHKASPIKKGWQFYILLNISKLYFNYKSFHMHVLTNMSLIIECSSSFLNAKQDPYNIAQRQKRKSTRRRKAYLAGKGRDIFQYFHFLCSSQDRVYKPFQCAQQDADNIAQPADCIPKEFGRMLLFFPHRYL